MCEILIYVLTCAVSLTYCQDFGYEGLNGPTHWGEKYHQCIGKHQSPIDIEEHDVEVIALPKMNFKNVDVISDQINVKNNGHTVLVTFQTGHIPYLEGGPLLGNYEFAQLHFHWGLNDAEGSENTVNNQSFPMELHVVFFQKSYGSLKAAVEHPDGLAVVACLFSNSEEKNLKYQELIDLFPTIEQPNTTASVSHPMALNDLLMKNRSIYYTYSGSLTTPPCSEGVTWIEFKETIPLAHEQIQAFRQLKGDHGKLSNNFRPTQPLHGRIIRMNQPTVEDYSGNIKQVHMDDVASPKGHSSQSNIACSLIMILLLLFISLFSV